MAAPMKHVECEKPILFCSSLTTLSDTCPEVVKLFLQCRYEEILLSSKLFTAQEGKANENLSLLIEANIQQFMQEETTTNSQKYLEILVTGLACLQLFVQNNWLGPPTDKPPGSFVDSQLESSLPNFEKEAERELTIDGDSVYTQCRFILYLYMARIILLEGRSHCSHIQTWDWWLMRCLMVQHKLLEERSPTLKATVLEIIKNLSNAEPLMTDDANRDAQVLFHVEAGHACIAFLEYRQAAEHFKTAKKIAGLQVKLSGAMGKRTRYQEENKAQLILSVTRDGESEMVGTYPTDTDKEHVPKNLPLDDDTVLNQVKFADDRADSLSRLSEVEQVLVLGLMESHRRSVAEERLTTEELLTYLEHILSFVSNWSVSVSSLTLRSKLQRDSSRRVERSMMQLEELVKMARSPVTSHSVDHRVSLFYAVQVPPVWTLQGDLADLLLSLGLIGEALDVFQQLEMWEEVIYCYQKLQKVGKAESLIRERLAIKETHTLYCYLGNITNQMSDYEKAWELSNHHSARAMRCMGYLHFKQERYEEALECFAKSLELNALQVPVWFTYGCTAMACKKFEVATVAFKRCVNIDYDNFEAWSNMATCYVKLNNKDKAFATLEDALKCNYEHWQLWENCLVIGTDCGHFDKVILAYNRLIDLKGKWVDNEVLTILTRAVTENLLDAEGNPASRLDKKLMELLGRITSKVTAEGEIWSNYGKLYSTAVGTRQPDMEKALQYLQKAQRCHTTKADWEKDVEKCKKVATQSENLAKVYMQCAEGKTQQEGLQLLSAAKLMLRGVLVKVQKQHTDSMTQELNPEVASVCETMDTTLSVIMEKIQSVRGS